MSLYEKRNDNTFRVIHLQISRMLSRYPGTTTNRIYAKKYTSCRQSRNRAHMSKHSSLWAHPGPQQQISKLVNIYHFLPGALNSLRIVSKRLSTQSFLYLRLIEIRFILRIFCSVHRVSFIFTPSSLYLNNKHTLKWIAKSLNTTLPWTTQMSPAQLFSLAPVSAFVLEIAHLKIFESF